MMRATGPRRSMDSGYFFTFFFFSFVALLPSQAYSQPRLERFILFKLKSQRTFVILGCNEKKVWKSLLGRNVFNVFFDVCRLSRKVSRGLQSSLPDKWHSTRICVSCMRIKHCIICSWLWNSANFKGADKWANVYRTQVLFHLGSVSQCPALTGRERQTSEDFL